MDPVSRVVLIKMESVVFELIENYINSIEHAF